MINKIRKSDFDINSSDFGLVNKRYYQEKEEYDWIEVTDRFKGLESFFHFIRQMNTKKLIKRFGKEGMYLDAGCGTGLILRHLPKGSVGLDINPRHIEKAKRHCPDYVLVLGDIEKLPFTDNAFSTVICTEVFEHLPVPQLALGEVMRVLQPDGVLIGTVPAKNPIWKLRFLSSTHPGEPYHKEYRKKEIINLFSGKKVIFLQTMNFFMSWGFVIEK